jgi:hypothetical protein
MNRRRVCRQKRLVRGLGMVAAARPLLKKSGPQSEGRTGKAFNERDAHGLADDRVRQQQQVVG